MQLNKSNNSIEIQITAEDRKKQEIRKELLAARANLPISYMIKIDKKIIQMLLSLPEYKASEMIFCFIGVRNEIDTMPFINAAMQAGKCVCAPRCIDNETMEARVISGFNDLERGMYGLMEPNNRCRTIEPAEIDLAIIPCLACDAEGHRIGYGGGYYDKYMADKRFCKAVLCREQDIIDNAPVDSYDVTVDIVITEKQIYRRKATGSQEI